MLVIVLCLYYKANGAFGYWRAVKVDAIGGIINGSNGISGPNGTCLALLRSETCGEWWMPLSAVAGTVAGGA